MKHVIAVDLAVAIAANIGQIWEIKHSDEKTVVIVTGNRDNEDYCVSWVKGTDKVSVEPWIW